MTKDEVLNLRVPADVKAALKRAAEADDRSVSSMVLRIVREWLVAHSVLGRRGAVAINRPSAVRSASSRAGASRRDRREQR